MLYIVGTPIGNNRDISDRAKDILESVDLIACEDTRKTGLLLKDLQIRTKLISYHEHNRSSREKLLLENLSAGKNVALVSDAGMPCISDPGEQLVRLCAQNGIPTTVIPGPTALASALAISGLETRRFFFEGFLPSEGKERKQRLSAISSVTVTLVLYEAPHRLIKTLSDLIDHQMGGRNIAVCRELTKKYEQVIRTTVGEAAEYFTSISPKGEFVLVIEGANPNDEEYDDADMERRILELADSGFSTKKIASVLSAESGESKNLIYSKALLVLKYRKDHKDSGGSDCFLQKK